MSMSRVFDPESHACYLRVSDAVVSDTVQITDNVYVDLDERGCPIGIEILGVIGSDTLVAIPGVEHALALYSFSDESRRFVRAQSASATALAD